MAQDFIDTAVDKAMAAFDIAKKKTEEVVAVSKQKIDVASIENKLDKLYKKLGKAYYTSTSKGVDSSDEINSLIADISTKLDEIKSAKEQAAEVLNKRVCPACSEYNEKKATYCSKCGTQLQ